MESDHQKLIDDEPGKTIFDSDVLTIKRSEDIEKISTNFNQPKNSKELQTYEYLISIKFGSQEYLIECLRDDFFESRFDFEDPNSTTIYPNTPLSFPSVSHIEIYEKFKTELGDKSQEIDKKKQDELIKLFLDYTGLPDLKGLFETKNKQAEEAWKSTYEELNNKVETLEESLVNKTEKIDEVYESFINLNKQFNEAKQHHKNLKLHKRVAKEKIEKYNNTSNRSMDIAVSLHKKKGIIEKTTKKLQDYRKKEIRLRRKKRALSKKIALIDQEPEDKKLKHEYYALKYKVNQGKIDPDALKNDKKELDKERENTCQLIEKLEEKTIPLLHTEFSNLEMDFIKSDKKSSKIVQKIKQKEVELAVLKENKFLYEEKEEKIEELKTKNALTKWIINKLKEKAKKKEDKGNELKNRIYNLECDLQEKANIIAQYQDPVPKDKLQNEIKLLHNQIQNRINRAYNIRLIEIDEEQEKLSECKEKLSKTPSLKEIDNEIESKKIKIFQLLEEENFSDINNKLIKLSFKWLKIHEKVKNIKKKKTRKAYYKHLDKTKKILDNLHKEMIKYYQKSHKILGNKKRQPKKHFPQFFIDEINKEKSEKLTQHYPTQE